MRLRQPDRPDNDEGVEEVALDAGRGEGGVARLEEHDAHDVVADVALSLELHGKRDKEHYFSLVKLSISSFISHSSIV